MRLMVTYRSLNNGGEFKVADVHVDDPDLIAEPLSRQKVAADCYDIISVVEVLAGVDYDKQGMTPAQVDTQFTAMLLK